MLAGLDKKLFRKVFRKVVDNGKMLRNVIQVARSGQAGKVYNLSAGAFRHAIQEWFDKKSPAAIFKASIGNDPSMRDILRMARPVPRDAGGIFNEEKATLFAYLLDCELKDGNFLAYRGRGADRKVYRAHPWEALPQIVKEYEAYKKDHNLPIPDVDFRFLDHLIDAKGWEIIAERAGWTMTRMNLNTFQRHGVFNNDRMVRLLASRLANREEVLRARAFPYQLLMAYKAADVPPMIRDGLQEAMEAATENVPVFAGQTYVAVDVSGSMHSPISGYRDGSSSKVQCVDVAALYAATVLRNNRLAEVLPFDTVIHDARELNPRDSIVTNAAKLARYGGGGTNCALALETLNKRRATGDAVVFISDCESWVDNPSFGHHIHHEGTKMMAAWKIFKKRNPKARLVCIDLTPRSNSQVKEHEDILQVGGWSDQCFEVVNSFLEHGSKKNHWVSEIEKVSLD